MKLLRVNGMAVTVLKAVGNTVAQSPREKGVAVDIMRTAGKT